MRNLLFGVFALAILATSAAWALPCDGPGPYAPPDAYQPYQPCANDGDCPAGKQCVNFRQVWDQWRGGYVMQGECQYPAYNPPYNPNPGQPPYNPNPGQPPYNPNPGQPPYNPNPGQPDEYQPCANDGDCPQGKRCDMRQVWNEWTRRYDFQGQCVWY